VEGGDARDAGTSAADKGFIMTMFVLQRADLAPDLPWATAA